MALFQIDNSWPFDTLYAVYEHDDMVGGKEHVFLAAFRTEEEAEYYLYRLRPHETISYYMKTIKKAQSPVKDPSICNR